MRKFLSNSIKYKYNFTNIIYSSMKYLKRFNEAIEQDNIDLCCVDLYDDGFQLLGYNKTGNTLVTLQKKIVSQLDEWNGHAGTDTRVGVMWDEHLSKYQPGTITITGDNFDKIETSFRQTCGWDRTKPLPFTDDENKLISQVTNVSSILSHYSDTEVKRKRVDIQIVSRGLQNPMNFEYTRYITQINILFYL